MIKHIVMWKLKEQAGGLEKSENAIEIKKRLESLRGVINEIKSLEVGININSTDESAYDACLISEFDTMEALGRYQVHPEHKKISEFVKSVRVSRTTVDFEI